MTLQNPDQPELPYRPDDADPEQNYCRCGCYTKIATHRKDGNGFKRFVSQAHSIHYRQQRSPAWIRHRQRLREQQGIVNPWTTARLRALTPVDAQELPDALLAAMMRRHATQMGRIDTDFTQMLANEVRRRGLVSAYHWANRITPSGCSVLVDDEGHVLLIGGQLCGKRGDYQVGPFVYCRAHVREATARRQRLDRSHFAPKTAAMTEARQDFLDRVDKGRQLKAGCDPRRARKARK